MKNLYIGTSGFSYGNWKDLFYPEGIKSSEMLRYYATKLNTVEINTTFYHSPRETTVDKWKETVPEDFVFTFKVFKEVSHAQDMKFDENVFQKFLYTLEKFNEDRVEKSILLFQMPASLRYNIVGLKKVLEIIKSSGFDCAFEFRNSSWLRDDVYELFRSYNASIVLSDSPQRYNKDYMWPRVNIDTADFFYIRLHGSKELYTSDYNEEELNIYGEIIKQKLKDGKRVFCYFNNTVKGYGVGNALKLRGMVNN
jgi:uncharacterized protein YecE (DUF72 family)